MLTGILWRAGAGRVAAGVEGCLGGREIRRCHARRPGILSSDYALMVGTYHQSTVPLMSYDRPGILSSDYAVMVGESRINTD